MSSDQKIKNPGRTNGAADAQPKTKQVPATLLQQNSDYKPSVSVVIPTLNEEEGIRECIQRVKNALDAMGLQGEVIVSDSSTDRTPEIAREMGAIVVHPDREGYGYAYRYAFEHVRGDYVVIGDADTTYDFEELPKLFDLVANEGADMAMGSRLEGTIKPGAMPTLHQYVGNPLLTKFLNTFYGAGVSDAHSGFRVLETETLEELDLETDGMEFASEMIMEAGARDLEIRERPITYHERKGEATLESFTDGWRHVKFMLLNAPGYLFSVPGLAAGGLGLAIMAVVALGIEIAGVSLGLHSMLAGSLLTIIGYQIASFGAFSTVAADPIRAPNDPFTQWLLDRSSLEREATVGMLAFGGGVAYAGYLAATWISSGFEVLPMLTQDIAALTAIVLGLQIVFSAFFMSAIAD